MAVAVAWIPLRQVGSSVDVALALTVIITAAGATGRRAAVAAAAVSAAIGFTFFDTTPYEHFAFTRFPDAITALLLVVVGLATGELAVRVARQARPGLAGSGDMNGVRRAAAALAAGDELVTMIGSVAGELTRLLGLRDCWFAAEPVDTGVLRVEREGYLRRGDGGPPLRSVYRLSTHAVLPVWGQGQVLGHFVLVFPPGRPPGHERLLVAVTLADQVGAALFAQAPPVPDPPQTNRAVPGLRVIR